MIFGEGLTQIKDVCYLIAIDTRRLGEAAARRRRPAALDLAIKFFNTYLRATFNANDIRTAYNTLHQYRQLGEMIIGEGRQIIRRAASRSEREQWRPASAPTVVEHRAVEIARFMRYYSGIAFQRGMVFIAEVIAHDIGTLCAEAFRARSACHQQLLRLLARGRRRHRVRRPAEGARAASAWPRSSSPPTTCCTGAVHIAKQVADDMANEDHRRLRGMWQSWPASTTASSGRSTTAASTSSTCRPSKRPCCRASSRGSRACSFDQPDDDSMNLSVRLRP